MISSKYRVWDSKSKIMYKPNEIIIIQVKGDGILTLHEETSELIDEFALMPSTGVNDAQGIEYFSGDIVQNINSNERGIICHGMGSFWLEYENRIEGLFEGYDTARIIGNIYENKDLLLSYQYDL